MSTQNITDPILLDSTGQQILSAIQDLTTAVQPTNVYVDIASMLSVSGWSSAVPSVYTWTNSKVTGECAVEVFFSTGAESAPTPYIEYEKGVGSVIFYAPTGKPTVNLPVVIRIINAEADIASDIDADMVSTNAISGSSNVQEALTSVNSSLGTINSNINTLNSKFPTKVDKTNMTDGESYTYTSQSAMESGLVSLATTVMGANKVRTIFLYPNFTSQIFGGAAGCAIISTGGSSSYFTVLFHNYVTAVHGTYLNGTWSWEQLALKSDKLDNSNSNHTISLVGDTSFIGFDIRPTGASNFFRLNFFDNGKVTIARYANSAWQAEATLRNAD